MNTLHTPQAYVCVECGHQGPAGVNCPECPSEVLLPANDPDTRDLQRSVRTARRGLPRILRLFLLLFLTPFADD